MLRSTTVASEPVVGDNSHTGYHQCVTLIRRYFWMKRPGPTLHDRVHETGSTDVLCTQVAGGCLFLQPDSMIRVLSEDEKEITIPRCGFYAVGKNGSC